MSRHVFLGTRKVPFLSRISGTRKMKEFLHIREIRVEKRKKEEKTEKKEKKERKKERKERKERNLTLTNQT